MSINITNLVEPFDRWMITSSFTISKLFIRGLLILNKFPQSSGINLNSYLLKFAS
jgi:hypothetical protein